MRDHCAAQSREQPVERFRRCRPKWTGCWMVRMLAAVAVFVSAWTAEAHPADAQQSGGVTAGTGPLIQEATVAVRSQPVTGLAPTVARPLAVQMRQRTKLMLFGTAIFIAGAIIGDDIGTVIMVGGAATALYGLYLTLWPPEGQADGAALLTTAPAPASWSHSLSRRAGEPGSRRWDSGARSLHPPATTGGARP
jgi:hypothetical protein